MRTAALLSEYLAAMRAMTFPDLQELLVAGISIETVAAVCPARTRIRLKGERRYCPDPDGGRAHVFPVTAVDPTRLDLIETDEPAKVVSLGPIVDLMAISIKAPGRWALRVGAAAVLGAVEHQFGLFTDPVPIHRDPLSWLRSCEGIVLLTGDAHLAGHILRQLTAPQAENPEHKAEIDHLMTFAYPLRSIALVRPERVDA
jgi:hypothetical protein